jgi:hypothetical protein
MALEPQPQPGALAGAAAGPARCAIETPYAAAAALSSNAPGIDRNRRRQSTGCRAGHGGNRPQSAACEPNDPAAWGYAARSPMTGKIWRTTPPSRPDTFAARPRFSMQIARQVGLGGVEPFSFGPDKILPGTLHHSGFRPAPPSDHTPLARRSAFQQGRKRGRRGNSAAPAGLKYPARRFAVRMRDEGFASMEPWNFAVPLPLVRRSAGDSVNHRGVEFTLTRKPRGSGSGNFGSATGQVGKDRGTACRVGHAPRRINNRSGAEACSAPTDVRIGVRLIGVHAGTPGLSLLAGVQTPIKSYSSCIHYLLQF